MLIPYKNKNLDIEQLIKDSSDEFSQTYDWDGFILENDSFRLEYVRSNIDGYNRLYMDILANNPVIRIHGGMDPEDRSINGFWAGRLYVLNADPINDNAYVLAETERQSSLSLEDMGGDEWAYNWVKGMQHFAKECRKDTLVDSNEEWFENAAKFFWTVGLKCGLYEAYDNWASLYKEDNAKIEPKKGLLDYFKGFLRL